MPALARSRVPFGLGRPCLRAKCPRHGIFFLPTVRAATSQAEDWKDILPTSPLADQSFMDARDRWKQPKPAVLPYKKTKLQRRLERNAFAQMLATPNRWCPVTKVHLPAAFLQGFQLMAHPETQEPWWVPSALDPSQPVRPDSSEEEDCSNQVPGPVAYTLAREKMLRSFALASGKYRRGYAAFLRMSNSAELASTLTKAVWRQDMDTHLLELMRRRICERISYLAKLCSEQDRQYLLPYTSLEQLQSLHHLGCILLLDKEKGSVQDYGDMANAGLLAHHLPTLLGDEHAERLCTDSALLSGCSAIIVRGERTIPLQKQLWALQGYLS